MSKDACKSKPCDNGGECVLEDVNDDSIPDFKCMWVGTITLWHYKLISSVI